MPKKILHYLLPLIKKVERKKEEIIFEEGGSPDSMFFVLKGKVQMIFKKNSVVLPLIDFEKGIIWELFKNEGHCFGDEDIFGNDKTQKGRNFTAKAIEDCELLFLDSNVM